MPPLPAKPIVVGRYELCEEIGAGGMATVHFGHILGDRGFTRPVAIKRLHPHLARDPAFAAAFVDEAHLASGISHPNVVATLDVISAENELLLVMEYVAGASLWHLLEAAAARNEVVPVRHAVAIVLDALAGLHAVHEASDETGRPIGLVHRDVSPQNVMVGTDGRARMLDFGVAKATGRRVRERTRTGVIKGKLGYMAPEQFDGKVTRRSDIYAAAVVLWEAVTGRRLFEGETEGEIIHRVLAGRIDAPSVLRTGLSPELDAIVMRGLSMDPAARFETADAMAAALQSVTQPAPGLEVAQWVQRMGDDFVLQRPADGPPTERMSFLSARASGTRADAPTISPEPEIPAVGVRPRRVREKIFSLGLAGLAIGLAGAAVAMRSFSPAVAPRALPDAPKESLSASTALQPPPPPSATTLTTTPALSATAARPKAAGGPAKRALLAPHPSSIPSEWRPQGAKIIGVLDKRQ